MTKILVLVSMSTRDEKRINGSHAKIYKLDFAWEQTKNEANDRYKQTMSYSTLLHYEIIGRDR